MKYIFRLQTIVVITGFMWVNAVMAQSPEVLTVFQNTPVNFNGESPHDDDIERYQDGRILLKKVKAPMYPQGSDVTVKVSLVSAGDRWDKSGSLFVLPDTSRIELRDILRDEESYPDQAGIDKYPGIVRTDNYVPALEIMRFMTPFGVGYYSDEEAHPMIRYNRPVYVPTWAEKVEWEANVSELTSVLTGEFYIGVWIDTWTPEGYSLSVDLEYSGRSLPPRKVVPLTNTIYYAGQKHPDLFAYQPLTVSVPLPEDAKNVRLHYITTGHGGHSGGDEFIQIPNRVYFRDQLVLDTIPWRDDCAAFRRFNPSSGVWTRKDTARAYSREGKRMKRVVEERLASSDLSRSNWCPGSVVLPYVIDLGDVPAGEYPLRIEIDGTPIDGDKLNHWLVSAYVIYTSDN
ncbi:hypothetical protein KUV50_18160 [Membranicola marinus]|uniref:Peptide-N-glycosidase F N-terminal domain-containing protein n=1 Tax=Membranihabitans marinus TaxID=1227546 RepID=A0A953HQU5_9BACT|nr:PNGase F N-terminal domain-containing protein [Membranihabitans marinus]MBY5960082.1 hypothetical protein [Membranihabitans marinus]